MPWKSKSCNHKHLWHLLTALNRGAREMITNCDQTEKRFLLETQYHRD